MHVRSYVVKRVPSLAASVMLLMALVFLPASLMAEADLADNGLAGKDRSIDAVMIMDSSGSMRKTDPFALRKPAAKLFINLLSEQDRVSIVSFSDAAYPITWLTQLDSESNRSKAIRAADKISDKGAYTNLHAAVAKGLAIFKNRESFDRDAVLLLMSDGQMDIGDDDRETDLSEQIFEDLVPQLNENNIRVFTIAFTTASDQQLLKRLAEETEGFFALAETDRDLHKVFTNIFEQNKQPEMLPLTENRFMTDDSIREITIVANKARPDSIIMLENPIGDRFSHDNRPDSTNWFVSPGFDMITLKKPAPGEWKILFSDNDNKAYIVADLKMRTLFEFGTEEQMPVLNIRTWFEKDEATLTNPEIISSIKLEAIIDQPDNTTVNIACYECVNDNSEFLVNYKPQADGVYAATVSARSSTFERQQVFSFRASVPKQKPVISKPPEPAPAPEPEPAQEPEPEPGPAPEPEEDNSRVLILFGLANIVILLIAVAAYIGFTLIKKSKGSAQGKDNEENNKDEKKKDKKKKKNKEKKKKEKASKK